MLSMNVATFLRKARRDARLADQVRKAGTYAAMAELATSAGDPAPPEDWRAAFAERNARVLVTQMMRLGVMDQIRLAPVPSMREDLWKRIAAMDLERVTRQLITYKGWTENRARDAEHRYRRFFYLKATMPDGKAAPSTEIDAFWHQHIVNTWQYGEDCERVAGRFIHHTFLSSESPVYARELSSVWLSTVTCYEALFDEPYEETIGAALLERWPYV